MVISSKAVQLTLGIEAPDIPEFCATSPDEQMLNEVAAFDHIVNFMNIDDRKQLEIVRIGKLNPEKVIPRTLLFNVENHLSKELILKSTRKLTENKE